MILAPLAPYLSEELYSQLGHCDSIHAQSWPESDQVRVAELRLIVQVNGKHRQTLTLKQADAVDESTATRLALSDVKVKQWVKDKPKKTVFVPGKLINFVV